MLTVPDVLETWRTTTSTPRLCDPPAPRHGPHQIAVPVRPWSRLCPAWGLAAHLTLVAGLHPCSGLHFLWVISWPTLAGG